MIRFLYNYFRWVPVLGSVIKGLYITKLVGQITASANTWKPSPEMGNKGAHELEQVIEIETNRVVDEALEPLELGSIASIVKMQAVKQLSKSLTPKIKDALEKAGQKSTEAIGQTIKGNNGEESKVAEEGATENGAKG